MDQAIHPVKWNEETVKRIWDFYGESPYYRSQYFTNHSGHRMLRVINRIVDIKATIVDYGCGPGFLLKHLESYNAWQKYIGIDSSTQSLKQIKK